MAAGAVLAATAVWAASQQTVWFHTAQNQSLGLEADRLDSLFIDANGTYTIATTDGALTAINGTLSNMTVDDNATQVISIDYNTTPATVVNPLAFSGVSVAVDGGAVTVTSTTDAKVKYTLKGAGTSFKLYSATATTLTLDGVTLTNPNGAAINIQSKKATTLVVADGTVNTLADGATYATPDGEKENGTLFSLGNIDIQGKGTLSVSALCKHAIASSKAISVADATVTVTAAASDGLHADGITVNSGTVTTRATVGDGIDAGKEQFVMTGGHVDVAIAEADTKGIKADGDIALNGGDIVLNVSAAQGKGIKTKANLTLAGTAIDATMTGDAVVVDYDPSYCTTIKVDSTFVMNSGIVKVTSSGKAGKGISVDGDARFEGGTVNITVSGDGDVYTDSLGVKDSYSSTCITVDGNLDVLGGEFDLLSTGTAGKCLKSDLAMTIGRADGTGPTIKAKTTGAKFLVSNGTENTTMAGPGGGGPGGGGFPGGNPGGGPGGMDDNADYANPKVVKAEGNLTVYGGKLTIESTQDGGEGLESKATLTINGGDINITTVDDCINGKAHIQFNGGVTRCVATGNDAIDSNGTMTITGGVVMAVGANSPEGSFDCDQNTFTVTGGCFIGLGGDCSTPAASVTKQPVVITSATLSNGQRFNVCDSTGKCLISFVKPSVSTGNRILFSAPGMTVGQSVTLSTGGTVSGGTTNYELTRDCTLTGATTSSTVTLSSVVTNNGGGFGPGGR